MIPALSLLAGVVQLAPALTKLFGANSTSIEVAETAAQIARNVTGASDNEQALEALKADPALLIDYQKAILSKETTFEELYINDKQGARLRDIEFLKSGTRNYRADFLVGISVVIVFTILSVVILAADLNEYAKGALTTILGVFLNQLTNVFAFEFGTTRKNEDKDKYLFNQEH